MRQGGTDPPAAQAHGQGGDGMALICRLHDRECSGCMECMTEPRQIGTCAGCGDPIYENESHYEIDGEQIHEDCLDRWAEQFRVKAVS